MGEERLPRRVCYCGVAVVVHRAHTGVSLCDDFAAPQRATVCVGRCNARGIPNEGLASRLVTDNQSVSQLRFAAASCSQRTRGDTVAEHLLN